MILGFKNMKMLIKYGEKWKILIENDSNIRIHDENTL